MAQFFYRLLIELTNGRWTSFLLQKFVRSRISGFFVPAFARAYKINVEESEQPLQEYKTLHHFFTRKLKEGARTVDDTESSVISPVDGKIEAYGKITEDLTIRVKDKNYSVLDMLGREEKVRKYLSGSFVVIYLSPSNYHRIHSPVSGKVSEEWSLGKKSYPVNAWGLKYGKETLAKNFRKITEIEHEEGYAALVKVGAMFVNSIETTYKNKNLTKGEEMAFFTFGSTVILLFEKETFELRENLPIPSEVRMGERIGFLKVKS